MPNLFEHCRNEVSKAQPKIGISRIQNQTCLWFVEMGLCKIYLRRLRGSRFARAAEDNAAQRRCYSGSSLRGTQRCECRCGPPLRETAARAVLMNCNINMRQPNPRQKRFREKVGRGGGALRIGDFLILKNAKHPIQRSRKADPEIVSPRRFFGYLLSAQKVT